MPVTSLSDIGRKKFLLIAGCLRFCPFPLTLNYCVAATDLNQILSWLRSRNSFNTRSNHRTRSQRTGWHFNGVPRHDNRRKSNSRTDNQRLHTRHKPTIHGRVHNACALLLFSSAVSALFTFSKGLVAIQSSLGSDK